MSHLGLLKSIMIIKGALITSGIKCIPSTPSTLQLASFAREAIAKGQVDIRYIASARNVADIFTKPLTREVFQGHRSSLGLAKAL